MANTNVTEIPPVPGYQGHGSSNQGHGSSNQGHGSSNQGIGDQLYDGASGLGRFMTDIKMVIGLIIGLVLLSVGVYSIMYNDDYKYLYIDGKVLASTCNERITYDSKGRASMTYICDVTVGYRIDGNVYSKLLTSRSSTEYLKNDLHDMNL